MISYILLFLLLTNTSLFYCNIFNKKIEQTLFLSIFSYILILFIFGIFNNLNVGFYIILILNFLLLIYNIYIIIAHKKDIKKFISTTGFILFILSYIFILYLSIGRKVYAWDEFSHWATKVKNLYYLNTINLVDDSTVIFDYLSGTSIFNYFCTKLSGYYNESMLYIGQNLIISSMLLYITSIFENKKKMLNYILYSFILLIPTLFYSDIYTSLYVDGVLGICFAYSLYSYLLEKENKIFRLINLIASLTMLVFIKDSGLLLAIFSYITINIINIIRIKDKKIWKNNKWYFLIIIPPILINYIWKIALKLNMALVSFGKDKLLSNILTLFKLHFEEWQKTSIKNFILALNEKKIISGNFITFFIAFIILIFIGYLIINNSKKEDKKENKILVIALIISLIIYVFSLMILYIVSFSEYEAINLASFERYLGTILLGVLLIFIVLLTKILYGIQEKLIKYFMISLVLISFVYNFTIINNLTFMARVDIEVTNDKRDKYSDIEKIKDIIDIDDKIYYISTNSAGEDYFISRYLFTPYKIYDGPYSIGYPYSSEDVWTVYISPLEFRNIILNNCDYVYIFKTDKEFIDLYEDLFINKIEDKKLYKVIKTQELGILKAVN